MKLHYIEKDGMVFLVRKNNLLSLPEKKEIPFKFNIVRKMPIKSKSMVHSNSDLYVNLKKINIFYCIPEIDHHPAASETLLINTSGEAVWLCKDVIPSMDNVSPIVQLAINRTLVRHVSDAIIMKDGKILMVKSSRGIITGIWDIPGGYIGYGESPEESLVREVREETGLTVRVKSLIHVNTAVVGGFYYIAFIYLCEPVSGQLKPNPDEISEAEWMPLEKAIRSAKPLFIKKSLKIYRSLLKKGKV